MADPEVESRKEWGLNAVSHLLALRGQLGEAEGGYDTMARELYWAWPQYQSQAKNTLKAGVAAGYERDMSIDAAQLCVAGGCLDFARQCPVSALPRVAQFVHAAWRSIAVREGSGNHLLFVQAVERINLRIQENR